MTTRLLPFDMDRAPVGACARLCRVLAAALLGLGLTGAAKADGPVKGAVSVYNDGGYTRILFRFDEEVQARVDVGWPIMVIHFDKPVDVGIERININAPEYVSAARRDPDGTAVRIALTRKVKVNTIPAGERFYVDLLPETWKGVLPGLPQEVVDDLARRVREAERQLNKQRLGAKDKVPPLTRVRVARLPTFIRYVFEMPATTSVVPEQSDGKLTLNFDEAIKWDLADVKASMPSTLENVDTEADLDSAKVTFTINGKPEVRTFREDRSIVVDVGTGGEKPKPSAAAQPAPKPATASKAAPTAPLAIDAPETVPAAKDVPAAAAPKGELVKPNIAPKAEAPKAEVPQIALAKLEATMAETAKPETAKPEATKAETPKPEAAKSEAAKSEAAKPEAVRAEAPKAEPASREHVPAKETAPVAQHGPAAPAAAPTVAPAKAVEAAKAKPDPSQGVVVNVQQSGDTLRLEFPFASPTPAAVFRRADVLWLVFDADAKINLSALEADGLGIRSASFERGADGEGIVRIKLRRPRLASLTPEGPGWVVTIADTVTTQPQPLAIARTTLGKTRPSLAIPFDEPSQLHIIRDPEMGDRLMVVTAPRPVRGFPKRQDFAELSALPTSHGVVVQPIADDVATVVETGRVTISRPRGLSLSSAANGEQQVATNYRSLTFDPETWIRDREGLFLQRQSDLIRAAAAASEAKRKTARFDLARFYLAREMAEEAKGVIEVALGNQREGEDVTGSIMRAVADILMDRPEEALKGLASPQVSSQPDAPLWRGMAYARQGKWPEARQAFRAGETTIASLPLELQRKVTQEYVRAAIETGDFTNATRLINDFATLGVPAEMEESFHVLTGRLNEGLGRKDDALAKYRAAAAGGDRRAAAQGRLREIELMHAHKEMPTKDVITALETLTTIWRGDETETEGLKLLAHLYTEEGRYRDAFHVMRTALRAHPNSDLTRKIQDEAAATFDSLFLEGKGDSLPPIEALGLFYDYRELTPIGRRGDEMIRRLADRLVGVDLLDQAAELLQHQVDHRLQGAARAQVATRLAVIYLMNHKPARTLATLQATRSAELSNELREQRLLLEARALSDVGRHALALEVVANIKGREAIRLRGDVLWAAKKWREAAEQLELLHGDRWRDFAPLSDGERTDVLRAAIGYSLGDEAIGLGRLRDKYAPKMAGGPDARAFAAVTAAAGGGGQEFTAVARRLGGVDTLQAFLRDIRARYPEAAPPALAPKAAEPTPAKPDAAKPDAAKPEATKPEVAKPEAAVPSANRSAMNAASSALPPKAPAGTPLRPDMTATGSISRLPPPRPLR